MLRQALFACISAPRVLAEESAARGAGLGQLERYQVPYTLAVSSIDKLTLELDFSAVDLAGGDRPSKYMKGFILCCYLHTTLNAAPASGQGWLEGHIAMVRPRDSA